MFSENQIAFIGSGTMAEAMIRGLLSQKLVKAGQIIAAGPRPERGQRLHKQHKVRVTTNNCEAAEEGQIVILAVKPQVLPDVMAEIRGLHTQLNPAETLFVVDAMTGQDAANTAKAFNDALPLTGVILTKADGDARGGAALSVRYITGKPIKFIGMGEKSEALEPFYPDRIASRILGMGDVLSLIEEAERKVDKQQAEKLARKIKKGKGFDLADLRDQLEQMMDMGGMGALLDKLPMPGNINAAALKDAANERQLRRQVAIINSMTPGERRFPKTINGSRKKRIATGSGLQVQDVNRLLKQYTQMEKMMKKVSKGGMKRMLRGLPGGRLPPGMR